jgi:hypothetical protein
MRPFALGGHPRSEHNLCAALEWQEERLNEGPPGEKAAGHGARGQAEPSDCTSRHSK